MTEQTEFWLDRVRFLQAAHRHDADFCEDENCQFETCHGPDAAFIDDSYNLLLHLLDALDHLDSHLVNAAAAASAPVSVWVLQSPETGNVGAWATEDAAKNKAQDIAGRPLVWNRVSHCASYALQNEQEPHGSIFTVERHRLRIKSGDPDLEWPKGRPANWNHPAEPVTTEP